VNAKKTNRKQRFLPLKREKSVWQKFGLIVPKTSIKASLPHGFFVRLVLHQADSPIKQDVF
jgi:hypothetical protein